MWKGIHDFKKGTSKKHTVREAYILYALRAAFCTTKALYVTSLSPSAPAG